MAKGHKSVFYYQPISKALVVLVQGSRKTYGICDIILYENSSKEIIDHKTKKKRIVYDKKQIKRLSDVLSVFQGRQINSQAVREELSDYLDAYLNSTGE